MASKKPSGTVVDETGLRFSSKVVGSPFGSRSNSFHSPTMSCFKCGKHRPRDTLEHRRILGTSRLVCKERCPS